MSQRHPKKPCAMEGCRAYAQRGQDFCAAHLRSRRLRERSEEALALLRRVTEQAEAEPLADLEVLERELRQLFSARKFFMAWVDRLQRTRRGRGSPQPNSCAHGTTPPPGWCSSSGRAGSCAAARPGPTPG